MYFGAEFEANISKMGEILEHQISDNVLFKLVTFYEKLFFKLNDESTPVIPESAQVC